ncbi:MAG: iron-containing alcohol dehydrogenase [Dongiaceae bacterium]
MSGLFNVEVGPSLIRSRSKDWKSYVVVTTATPWKLAQPELSRSPAGVEFVESNDVSHLDQINGRLPDADYVVSIGGAGCQEAAKYFERKRGAARIHVPTVVSNNAALTTVMTVFRGAHRDAIYGLDPPRAVLYDLGLVKSAKRYVNRSGMGEQLCVHVGSYDWRLASSRGLGLTWSHGLAREMATITTRCLKVAPLLKDLPEAAITELVALWLRVGELIDQYGCMNFTGASEHVFALNLTRVTGKRLIHGQCVGLGVVVMSFLQRNAPEVMAEAFVEAGARFKPTDIGCTWDDVAAVLRTLPEQARRMRDDTPYSIADEVQYSPELLAEVRAFVEPYPTPTDDEWPIA